MEVEKDDFFNNDLLSQFNALLFRCSSMYKNNYLFNFNSEMVH